MPFLFRLGKSLYIRQTSLPWGFQWQIVPTPPEAQAVPVVGFAAREYCLPRKEWIMPDVPVPVVVPTMSDMLDGHEGFAMFVKAPLINGQPGPLQVAYQWGRPSKASQLDILTKQTEFMQYCLAMAKQDALGNLPDPTPGG